MRKLAGAMLVTMTALATGQQQSDTKELRVLDIRAQQTPEKIAASAPCQRALESPHRIILQNSVTAPQTLVPDLNTLMEKSDEVILAGASNRYTFVLSPSGENVVGYFEVKVIRSWKGVHKVGDILTFGVPAGVMQCTDSESHRVAQVSAMYGVFDRKYGKFGKYVWQKDYYIGPYILFLRHAQGEEAQRVAGLFPTAGEGLQGMYPVDIPVAGEEERQCTGVPPGSLDWCASLLESSQYHVVVPYLYDPLNKKYNGMPISQFLSEVRTVAASQGLEEKFAPAR